MTESEKFYQIFGTGNKKSSESVDNLLKTASGNGFYRKAIRSVPEYIEKNNVKFVDSFKIDKFFGELPNFSLQAESLKVLRNNQQFSFFGKNTTLQFFVKEQKEYPSFVTELAAFDQEFTAYTFINDRYDSSGYIEYFVLKNGRYYIGCIDDIIPIDAKTKKPLWGLSLQQPWKLLLMKAWIKEKGGFKGIIDATPMEFLRAFGMPAYKVVKIEKEIKYLQFALLTQQDKQKSMSKIAMFKQGIKTLLKTRNLVQVSRNGLLKNHAGYMLTLYDDSRTDKLIDKNNKEQPLFKVYSEVPHHWMGKHCVGQSKELIAEYKTQPYKLNLLHQFLVTYQELVSNFDMFYSSIPVTGPIKQYFHDSIKVKNLGKPKLFRIQVIADGLLNFNVQLPQSCKRKIQNGKWRFPHIRCFALRGKEIQHPTNQHFFIQFIREYSKSCPLFSRVEKGIYYVYVEVTPSKGEVVSEYVVNLNSFATIASFKEYPVTDEQINSFARGYFRAYSRESGHRMIVGDTTELEDPTKNLQVYFDNAFERIGFGYICMRNYKSKHDLVMKIDTKQLRLHNIAIKYDGTFEKDPLEPNLQWYRVSKGKIQTIVFECLNTPKIQLKAFPPQDSFSFFDVEV